MTDNLPNLPLIQIPIQRDKEVELITAIDPKYLVEYCMEALQETLKEKGLKIVPINQ